MGGRGRRRGSPPPTTTRIPSLPSKTSSTTRRLWFPLLLMISSLRTPSIRSTSSFARLCKTLGSAFQVAALSAVGNIVVDFTTHRNLMCLADYMCKQEIFMELTASSLASLISDPEPFVQEKALALVRNLVDGCMKSVELVFAEDGIVLDAVGRQLQGASRDEIRIQEIPMVWHSKYQVFIRLYFASFMC
ncbi:hypothetical protein ACLB2K_002218 [Fragaria x ananassa]